MSIFVHFFFYCVYSFLFNFLRCILRFLFSLSLSNLIWFRGALVRCNAVITIKKKMFSLADSPIACGVRQISGKHAFDCYRLPNETASSRMPHGPHSGNYFIGCYLAHTHTLVSSTDMHMSNTANNQILLSTAIITVQDD